MMKKTLSPKIAFGIVFISLITAFFTGALVIGAGLSQPDSQQKIYNLFSFVVGQSFMLLPLLYFLIIKDFVVHADLQQESKEKLKVPLKDRSKVAREFILNNCEEFLAYAVDYSLYDKFFADTENFEEKI